VGDVGTDQPVGRDDDGDERKACGGRDPDGNGGVPAAATGEGAAEETRSHALDAAPCPHGHIGCRCPPDRYIFSVKKQESHVPEIELVLEQQRAAVRRQFDGALARAATAKMEIFFQRKLFSVYLGIRSWVVNCGRRVGGVG